MNIPIWKHDSNPSIDGRDYRRSRHYCAEEVAAGRARQLDDSDIRKGIQLLPPDEIAKRSKIEHRGSPEAKGCLTAGESELNADYRGKQTEIAHLAFEYEWRLDRHIAEGKKGTPIACSRIAARVKTLLSNPELSDVRLQARTHHHGRVAVPLSVARAVPCLSGDC